MRRETPDALRLDGTEAELDRWPAPWSATGVVRVLEPLVQDSRRERLRAVLARRLGSVTALLDAPHDPHNGAAILRSCDAFGVQTVHVVPRYEPFLAARTVSKGTERWVDVVTHATAEEAIDALASSGFELITTEADGELLPSDLPSLPRVALILGNERDGIRRDLGDAAHRAVRVPMRGFVESLNVSVAAGILLEAATRDRKGDLDPGTVAQLYARGLYRTVPRAREVLAAFTAE
jgi:tRNA (guanosine-2'-O-)-methyltransferase